MNRTRNRLPSIAGLLAGLYLATFSANAVDWKGAPPTGPGSGDWNAQNSWEASPPTMFSETATFNAAGVPSPPLSEPPKPCPSQMGAVKLEQ